jgi:phage terminase large subunit-like protein
MSDWDGTPEGWGVGHYRDVPVCKWVRLARERQVEDLRRSLSFDPSFPYYYDDEAADLAVWFMSQLVQFEGQFAGQFLKLADWQEWDIIRPIFGWKRRVDNKRRFSHADVFIPRKNGKSTLAGAIAGFMLIGDREFGGQVFCAATKEEQAGIVWKAAKKLLEHSPELRDYIKSYRTEVTCEALGSTLKKLGRDSKSQDGLNPNCGIVDEYHAHKTADMLNVLDSAMGMREQPLLFLISSFGVGESSPCQSEDRYCRNVLDKTIENESFFCYVTTVDDPNKWDDPIEWQKANPNLGISISLEKFRADCERAKQKPDAKVEFLSKRLNLWCNAARHWINMDRYSENDGRVAWERFKGQPCYAAFDLGISQDLSALALVFKEPNSYLDKDEDGNHVLPDVYVKMLYWIPEEGLQARVEQDGVPYRQWVEEGWIRTTPGATTRRDIIRRDINKLSEEFEIVEIAGDQAHAHQLMQELADDNFVILKHAQTMIAMNFPTRMFEELVLQKRLRHDNDPVLRWMVSNAVIVRDGNENIKIMKNKSTDRVDGVVAASMAIGRLLLAPKPAVSIYETQRLVVLG